MNKFKNNYFTNTVEQTYFDYWFFRKLIERTTPKSYHGEGTNFQLKVTKDETLVEVKSKGDLSQQTYTGKNLVYTGAKTAQGIKATYDSETGVTTAKGKATQTYAVFDTINSSIPAGTYTFSIQKPESVGIGIGVRVDGGTRTPRPIPVGDTSLTFTTTGTITGYDIYLTNLTVDDEYDISFQAQLEAGSTPTSFEPYVGGIPAPNPDYPQDINVVTGTQTVTITNGEDVQNYTLTLGSLELCKIGDYQDYIYKDGDDWYVHKEIRKVVLNGTEGWDKNGSYNNGFIVKSSDPSFQNTKYFGGYSNQYTIVNDSTTWQGAGKAGFNNSRVFWLQTIATDYTLQTFKESLSTNNIIVYCVESTAIDTEITDETLLEELETLLTNGYLLKGTNTITTSATSTNLPNIIYIQTS